MLPVAWLTGNTSPSPSVAGLSPVSPGVMARNGRRSSGGRLATRAGLRLGRLRLGGLARGGLPGAGRLGRGLARVRLAGVRPGAVLGPAGLGRLDTGAQRLGEVEWA